jgi:hypothetical protein
MSLLAADTLHFYLYGDVFILPSFFNYRFIGYRILGGEFGRLPLPLASLCLKEVSRHSPQESGSLSVPHPLL